MNSYVCHCCGRLIEETQWSSLYSCCDDCAFCASLNHFPCCHKQCEHPTEPAIRLDITIGDLVVVEAQ